VCCSVLQCIAVCCSAFTHTLSILWCIHTYSLYFAHSHTLSLSRECVNAPQIDDVCVCVHHPWCIHTHTLYLSFCLFLSVTHTHFLSLSPSFSLSFFPPLSLSHTHTQAHIDASEASLFMSAIIDAISGKFGGDKFKSEPRVLVSTLSSFNHTHTHTHTFTDSHLLGL